MKSFLANAVLIIGLTPAFAGGVTEPVMEETIITADTASSGGDNWVGVMMTLLVLGASVAGR